MVSSQKLAAVFFCFLLTFTSTRVDAQFHKRNSGLAHILAGGLLTLLLTELRKDGGTGGGRSGNGPLSDPRLQGPRNIPGFRSNLLDIFRGEKPQSRNYGTDPLLLPFAHPLRHEEFFPVPNAIGLGLRPYFRASGQARIFGGMRQGFRLGHPAFEPSFRTIGRRPPFGTFKQDFPFFALGQNTHLRHLYDLNGLNNIVPLSSPQNILNSHLFGSVVPLGVSYGSVRSIPAQFPLHLSQRFPQRLSQFSPQGLVQSFPEGRFDYILKEKRPKEVSQEADANTETENLSLEEFLKKYPEDYFQALLQEQNPENPNTISQERENDTEHQSAYPDAKNSQFRNEESETNCEKEHQDSYETEPQKTADSENIQFSNADNVSTSYRNQVTKL